MAKETSYRDDETLNFGERYGDIVNIVKADSAEIKDKNRDLIKNNTWHIYKHYLKQGLKYAVAGLIIGVGAALILNPAWLVGIIPFGAKIASLSIFSSLPAWLAPAVGAGLVAGGACGAISTRLNRNLEFNFNNDRKRARFYWRESRRIRRIEKALSKANTYMATNTPKANYFREKALGEIKKYENDSLNLYRETKALLKTSTKKYQKNGAFKEGMFWLGSNRFDNIEDIRLSQLYHLNQGALTQLKNADVMRKEAGLPQNEKVVNLFESIHEDIKDKDKAISDDVLDIIRERKELKTDKTNYAFREAIKNMLNDEKVDDNEFANMFSTYTNTYGLSAEDVFNECIKNNFGKRKASNTIGVVLNSNNLVGLSDKTQDAIEEQFKGMEKEEQENIINILEQRQKREKGKQQDSARQIATRLEMAM